MTDDVASVGAAVTGATVRIGGKEFGWRAGAVITIGRDTACDVVLDDPRVSRQHLVVEAAGDGTWRLRDAGSRNGVFIAGSKVHSAPLRSAVTVSLGAVDGAQVAIAVAAPAGPPQPPPAHSPAVQATPPPQPAPAGPAQPPSPQPPPAQPPSPQPPPGVQPPPAQPPSPQPPPRVQPPPAQPPPAQVGRLAEAGLGRSVSVYEPSKDLITIGRDTSNDLVLTDDPRASRRHAQLRKLPGGWEIADLGSHNGTFVNGARVSRARLADGDLVAVGNHLFVFGGGRLEQVSEADDTSLDAIGVTVTAGGTTLLHDVSFSLPSRSVLAVVGPSGAGKSTLVRALTGVLTPSGGQVCFAGRDLHSAYEEFRARIGSVPQDDLVHPELTPRSELELAAALRLPPDTGRDGRRARVDQVLAELGLTERAGLQISKLSGGQRKRVSVGTELLTQPTLLFLDEPTSGLDPGNEKQVMSVLRQLADGGRVVVVVTHATQSLELADRVLFLTRGGRVAYFGPPSGALAYFARQGVTGGYADIFRALDDPGETDWAARFRADADHDTYVGRAVRQAAVRRGVAGKRPSARTASPVPARDQFGVLVRRQLRILAGDRRTLILLAAQPLAFGLIIAFLFSATTLSTNHGPFAALMLWLLVVSATWLGASGTIREIVKELAIYRRERAVGLSIPAYVGSKFAVFGAITVAQSFVVVIIGLFRESLPPQDPRHFIRVLRALGTSRTPATFRGLRPFAAGSVLSSQRLEIMLAVALVGLAGTALGLAISALVRKSDQAVFLLPVVLVVEMALSLPLLQLQNPNPLIQQVSKVTSASWGMSAVASTVSMNQLMTPYLWDLAGGQAEITGYMTTGRPFAPPPSAVISALKGAPAWQHTGSTWLAAVAVLIVMMALLLAVAVLALRRQDIGRQAAPARANLLRGAPVPAPAPPAA
jgi:ABC transport system ATP-binding/permease protein